MTEGRDPAWLKQVPNGLTLLRLIAAGILPFAPVDLRLPLVLFAAGSDWLDGYIARRFHADSALGALLDGIADKAFVLAAVVTFVGDGTIEPWQGLAVMARDLTVALIAGWCVLRGAWSAFRHMRVRLPGKLTTALVLPWFATLLVPALEPVRAPLFWLAALTSAAAAVDYFLQFLRNPAGVGPAARISAPGS